MINGGIDQLVKERMNIGRSNPQALQTKKKPNVAPSMIDLLAAEKLKKQKQAAAAEMQMQQNPAPQTIAEQRNKQLADMTKQEIARTMGPTFQRQEQMRKANLQRIAQSGIAGAPRPPIKMAAGGLVAFNEGGETMSEWEKQERARLRAKGVPEAEIELLIKRARGGTGASIASALGIEGMIDRARGGRGLERVYAAEGKASLPREYLSTAPPSTPTAPPSTPTASPAAPQMGEPPMRELPPAAESVVDQMLTGAAVAVPGGGKAKIDPTTPADPANVGIMAPIAQATLGANREEARQMNRDLLGPEAMAARMGEEYDTAMSGTDAMIGKLGTDRADMDRLYKSQTGSGRRFNDRLINSLLGASGQTTGAGALAGAGRAGQRTRYMQDAEDRRNAEALYTMRKDQYEAQKARDTGRAEAGIKGLDMGNTNRRDAAGNLSTMSNTDMMAYVQWQSNKVNDELNALTRAAQNDARLLAQVTSATDAWRKIEADIATAESNHPQWSKLMGADPDDEEANLLKAKIRADITAQYQPQINQLMRTLDELNKRLGMGTGVSSAGGTTYGSQATIAGYEP